MSAPHRQWPPHVVALSLPDLGNDRGISLRRCELWRPWKLCEGQSQEQRSRQPSDWQLFLPKSAALFHLIGPSPLLVSPVAHGVSPSPPLLLSLSL